jgi:hypothetical protein
MRRTFTAMTFGVCCGVALAGANVQASPTNTQPAADAAPKSQRTQPASGISQPDQHEATCAEPKKSCEAPKIAACQNGGWVCIGPARPD